MRFQFSSTDHFSKNRAEYPFDSNLHLDHVTAFAIKFFFYYREDFGGIREHCHDLEHAEFQVQVSKNSRGLNDLLLERVVGEAHGSTLYRNELVLESDDDVALPMTLLVEEGKHASCPDRNGDGEYTPGYDVNKHVSDAWGVRDLLRSVKLVAPKYDAAMTKRRRGEDRVYLRRNDELDTANRSYELRRIPCSVLSHDPCEGRKHKLDLEAKMREFRFDRTAMIMVDHWLYRLVYQLIDRYVSGIPLMFRWSFRWDNGPHAVFGVADFRVPSGWLSLAIRGSLVPDRMYGDAIGGLDLIYSPSASRWLDKYGAVGLEGRCDRATCSSSDGSPTVVGAAEFGYKVKFPLWSHLWGAKLGIRFRGFDRLHDARMVCEVGPASF